MLSCPKGKSFLYVWWYNLSDIKIPLEEDIYFGFQLSENTAFVLNRCILIAIYLHIYQLLTEYLNILSEDLGITQGFEPDVNSRA